MAFNPKDMGVVGYCNGFTLWYYPSTNDTQSAISAAGYFNSFVNDLRPEDLIIFTDKLGRTGLRRISQLTGSQVKTAKPI